MLENWSIKDSIKSKLLAVSFEFCLRMNKNQNPFSWRPVLPFGEPTVYRCSIKKLFWKILYNLQEDTCAGGSSWTIKQKVTLTQVFSCKVCEIFKNTFFTEHLRVIAFENSILASCIPSYFTMTILKKLP